jgi:hypothetical protein
MWTEPYLATFGVDEHGHVVRFLGMNVAKSPKHEIADLATAIVEKSKWMFGKTDFRITGFHFDPDGTPWASTLANLKTKPTSTGN